MPTGFLDVTAVSEAQRNSILARKLSPERIQPRHNNFPHLRQFTVHQVENQATLYYVLNQLQGTAQPYVAYTPEALFGRSPHNGVTVPLPDLDAGSHTITYRWTIPSSNDPVLVDVQPTDLREPEIAYQTILPTGANEIQVDFNLAVSTEGQGSVQGEVLLNGQHLTNLNVASSAVNVMPLFRRARSGLYHLTVHHNGELLVDEAYVQRELAWQQPWPSIETGDVETPIPFSNTLVWKVDDQTFPTAEDQPRWRARFPGARFPPSSGSSQPYQSGSSVSFTWLPSSLEIVLSRARSEWGRFKLIPSDQLEPGEESVQARAPETTYSYSVEGQAVTYDSFTPVARQTVSAAGLVPARMRQVHIENARFEPSPPDPEQPSVFRADVQSYFFDDPQIKWTLQVESDDQGTTVRTFEQADWLDFDESFQIQVPWDRTDDQGQPSTGNHRATLRVWVQEKTLTNPNGSHPVVLAEETIDYFVPGTKTLELDYLFSEPPSLESGQVGPVTLIPYAIIKGFPTPPEVSWSITIEVPGLGEQILQGANNLDFFEASWEAAGADGGALPDGVYTVQVRAEIASEGLVAEKSFPFVIGTGQTGVLVENLSSDPNPVDFEEQPEGMKGAHFRADLTPIGFEEPVTAGWTLEIRLPGIDDPVRAMTGQIVLNAAPDGQLDPTPFETFWDGLDASGQLVSPGQYEVALIVDPCAGETPLAGTRDGESGGASTFNGSGMLQSESSGCAAGDGLLALYVHPLITIHSVRFGATFDLAETERGPFPVYDYENRTLNGTESSPHWVTELPGATKETSIPAPFVIGSELFVGAKLNTSWVPENAFKARIETSDKTGEYKFLNPTLGTTYVDVGINNLTDMIVFKKVGLLPDRVSRQSLELEWKIRFYDQTDRQIGPIVVISTPRTRRAHMLYTLLRSPIGIISGSGGMEFPWYSPKHFDTPEPLDRIDRRLANPKEAFRSPLDLATHWSAGSRTDFEVADSISEALYSRSSITYNGADSGVSRAYGSNISFDYSYFLKHADTAQCSELALQMFALCAQVGTQSDILRIEPRTFVPGSSAPGSSIIFTNYLKILNGRSNTIINYTAPLPIAGDFFGSATISLPQSPILSQYMFDMHQVSIVNGLVFDSSARPAVFVGSATPPISQRKNMDFYLNQLNLSFSKEDFERIHLDTYDRRPPSTVYPNSQPDYATSYGEFTEKSSLPIDMYLERILYLANFETDKRRTGYNRIGTTSRRLTPYFR